MKFKTTLESSFTLIDLTPLVDVIFLMLVFFIITSDILPLKSLNIENPKIATTSEARTTQILVVMDAENVIYVGSKKEIVDFNTFKETLQRDIDNNIAFYPGSDTTVVLSIDRRVDYGSFLRLFALAQETQTKLRLVYHEAQESLCSH
jgi:biopolymer transport protein ExbD